MEKARKTCLCKDSKEKVNSYSDFPESIEWKTRAEKLGKYSGVDEQKGLLPLSEIARKTLIPLTIIEKICDNNYGNLTKTEAERLEHVTGVCREAWMFPDRHFNPYRTDFASIVRNCLETREANPLKTKG